MKTITGLDSISFCILSFVRLSIIQFGVSVFNASACIASEANSSFKAEYTSWCCLTNDNPLMVFMKGTKLMPQCGFSNNVVQILNSLGVEFYTFDVLSDFAIREGIKEYSDWPTIPQVYLKGEFLGGSDILIEMYNSGSLKEKIEIELAS